MGSGINRERAFPVAAKRGSVEVISPQGGPSRSPEGASVPTPAAGFHVGEIQVNPAGCNPEEILEQLADLLRELAVVPPFFIDLPFSLNMSNIRSHRQGLRFGHQNSGGLLGGLTAWLSTKKPDWMSTEIRKYKHAWHSQYAMLMRYPRPATIEPRINIPARRYGDLPFKYLKAKTGRRSSRPYQLNCLSS